MLVWTHTVATLNVDFYPSTHTIPTFFSLNTHDSYLKAKISVFMGYLLVNNITNFIDESRGEILALCIRSNTIK